MHQLSFPHLLEVIDPTENFTRSQDHFIPAHGIALPQTCVENLSHIENCKKSNREIINQEEIAGQHAWELETVNVATICTEM